MTTPANIQAEEVLISCIFIDELLLDSAVTSGLSAESFSDPQCAILFEAAVAVRAGGRQVDIIAVSEWVKATGNTHKCSIANMSRIMGAAETTLHFANSLEITINKASQRAALREARELVKLLEGEYASAEDIDAAIGGNLARIANSIKRQEAARNIPEIVDDAIDALDRRVRGEDQRGMIHFGIMGMDKFAQPIAPWELVVIAARPSVGKSSLARQIGWEAAKAGKRVVSFLLETSDVSFVEACAAQESRVSLRSVKEEPRDKMDAYRKHLDQIRGMKNVKLYDKDMTMAAIESRLRMLRSAFRPELVIVDYLQIIRRPPSNASTADQIGDITRTFVSLVKHLGCPIILMSQLNRESERQNREPGLSDLRDSGSIESDANRVIFIHRKSTDSAGGNQSLDIYRNVYECKLIQSKLRDGPRCAVDVTFHAPWATFYDATKNSTAQ